MRVCFHLSAFHSSKFTSNHNLDLPDSFTGRYILPTPFICPIHPSLYLCMRREAALARIGFLHLVGQKLKQAAQPGGVFSLLALRPHQEGSVHWTTPQDRECRGLQYDDRKYK